MYSKLISCLIVVQLSTNLYAAAPACDADLLARKEQDFKAWEQAYKGGKECQITAVAAAAKYFEDRYKQESNQDQRTWLHHRISSIYLNCPLECIDTNARHEMMLALQRKQIDAEKDELRRLQRKYEEDNSRA